VDEIVDYCAREFPNAMVWLNPVVTGTGKLRTANQQQVDADYLRRSESPNLLTAGFCCDAVEAQGRSEKCNWECKAGQMFFDNKPNGDVWICQDVPTAGPSIFSTWDSRRRFGRRM